MRDRIAAEPVTGTPIGMHFIRFHDIVMAISTFAMTAARLATSIAAAIAIRVIIRFTIPTVIHTGVSVEICHCLNSFLPLRALLVGASGLHGHLKHVVEMLYNQIPGTRETH